MDSNTIIIRKTNAQDFNAVMEVEKQAFGYDKEAKLTAELLTDPSAEPVVSLLARHNGLAVGHILFTRAYFQGQPDSPMMHVLAPLAVIPAYQRQGVGGRLIRAGLERLRSLNSELVFVLGHKPYYPQHGFIPGASRLGYPAPYPIPEEYDDCWMVQPIGDKGFAAGQGAIRCSDTLNKPQHWREDESDR